MVTMKSQQQFILDTLLPYKEDPTTRAVVKSKCLYLTDDGRKCAVGKHMKKGKWQSLLGGVRDIDHEFGIVNALKKSALKQEFTIEQWTVIQKYHDEIDWNKSVARTNAIVLRLERELNIDLKELKFEK